MKISRKTISTLIFCVYLAAIAVACFIKGDNVPDVQFTLFGIPTDKIVHFCMFAPYPLLSFLTFKPSEIGKGRAALLIAVLMVFGAGLAYGTEMLQGITDYRAYEIADFHADLVGLSFGLIVLGAFMIYKRK